MPPSTLDGPPETMRAQLAHTLKVLRNLKGLSQDALAKELYVSRELIASYETERNRPDERFCKELDTFFGTGKLFCGLWRHAQREHFREWGWGETYETHEGEATQIRTFSSPTSPACCRPRNTCVQGPFPAP
jgi:transcriptional regulator with XRE-family HTH domain